ncbi:ABC transporter substrate-binding protein [Argonema antarcticum]|uniref:ABC transporter substrate-binding protein n=1 Tax=Argonema antarcticum TaxID=2942763 RepID=UPI00201116CB|nr:ABC transporter substrate-binding protein [Argonema antarcticum]MCL1475456.1 ABC transporter substrate-binding protein [Argonema antarcticum A004/B2]
MTTDNLKTKNMLKNQLAKNLNIALILLTPMIGSLLFKPLNAWGEDIVLGMSAAFKGPSKELGIELYRGSMAYIDYINSQGGLNGKKIVIQAYDDSYDPTKTIKNTIDMVEKDKVYLLFNYVGTPTVTRMLPLLNRYSVMGSPAQNERVSPALELPSNRPGGNIYLFFPFTGAQPHRQEPYQKFVFNLRASYRQETEGLVNRFVQIGRKRIAVFYQIDAYGRSGWDGVRRSLAKNDLKIISEVTYRRGTPYSDSFKQQVEILKKANPDAVISIGSYAACAGFIRDARDAGWDIPIANISFVGSESLLELLQNTGQKTGKDYTKNLINSQVVPSYEDTSLPAVREYRQLMARYKPMPSSQLLDEEYEPIPYSFVSFEGFLNAKLLVEILNKMNKYTPISPPSLKIGDRGTRVTELQLRLEKEGVTPGTINGIFNNNTKSAVMAFQKSHSLVEDGIVGQKTWSILTPINLQKNPIALTVESIHNLDLGINTPVSFGAEKHQGLERVYYTTIEKGRFVPLTDWQRWAK